MATQIKYKFADIGHWLARCNHSTDTIELNATEFKKLSPLYKDYVWIHECVHLLYDVYDETACNEITDEIFLLRSSSPEDRKARQIFIRRSNTVSEDFLKYETVKTSRNDIAALIVAILLLLFLIKTKKK